MSLDIIRVYNNKRFLLICRTTPLRHINQWSHISVMSRQLIRLVMGVVGRESWMRNSWADGSLWSHRCRRCKQWRHTTVYLRCTPDVPSAFLTGPPLRNTSNAVLSLLFPFYQLPQHRIFILVSTPSILFLKPKS